MNARAIPGGSTTFTHTWSNSSTITFLLGARELEPHEAGVANVGNFNLLCESNESCILNRNIGGYQGDKATIVRDNPSDIATGGTIQNVEMWKYNTNGVP